jgi:hypothetical protein
MGRAGFQCVPAVFATDIIWSLTFQTNKLLLFKKLRALTFQKAESVNSRERKLFKKLRALTFISVNFSTLAQQFKVNQKF